MKKSTALFLVCSLVLISGFNAQDTFKHESIASPAANTKSTTTPSPDKITKSTTTTPSTTNSSTTTTQEPKTTTTIPTTTTSTTTTTTSTTTTSTTTTPASVPTTTNAPISTTPVPDPQAATWNVTDKNNVIIARMAVQLSITYNVKDEKVKNHTVLIDIPANNKTKASGIFTSNHQAIKLSWKSSGVKDNSLSLVFKSRNDTKTYWLSRLEVQIQLEDLPNIDSQTTPLEVFHEQGHFNTSLGNSYRCVKLQTFNLVKENDTVAIGHVKVTDLQFQAFKAGSDASFGLAEDCAFDTPDIVPIAVGCVLAGLVVIILVGYLITRRRSQARGYLSM